jgi:nucleotide-binding universal stress UspA family protein
MYKRIVVPLDGSDLALTAVSQAKDLARLYGARLVVVRVTHLPRAIASPVSMRGSGINPPFGVVVDEAEDTTNDDQAYIDGVVQGLSAEGFSTEGLVLSGIPATAIVSILEPGDLLVMTSQGHTGLRRFIMGSVAADVVKRATVPVLVMKSPDHE